MFITNELKIRFVRMLAKRQILVVQCKRNKRSKNYDFKFIGANEFEKFDFTPMIADTLHVCLRQSCEYNSILGIDAAEIVRLFIEKLAKDGIVNEKKIGYDLYEEVRDLLSTFYL